MSDTAAGLLTIGVLVTLLALSHAPLGGYLAVVYTSPKHWRGERWLYRVMGVDPEREQTWKVYAASIAAVSVVGFLVLLLLILGQDALPLAGGRGMHLDTAVNTAVSFVTNTNWQSYAGETGASQPVQALGLTVQNFVSAAVGICVAIALVRGIARASASTVGNFWVDLFRTVFRVLLPVACVGAVLLLLGGVIQNLSPPAQVTGVTGATQVVQGGLVGSQEAIKELGTNGGGFFNANSAHPFENPNALTDLLEIFLHAGRPVRAAPHLRD